MKLNNFKIKDRIMKIGRDKGVGHIGSALSCVDILCTIYNTRKDPIVILSKGHGALAQYVILNELGKLPDKILESYDQDGGLNAHSTLMPEYGVYASTGSLGHGLAIGMGYAIAHPKKEVWVVMGDGECDEGSVMESLKIIRKLDIKNVYPIVDVNGSQGFSKTNEEMLPQGVRAYYSEKGQDWDNEGEISSHYTGVDKDVYKKWKPKAKQTEKARLYKEKQYRKQYEKAKLNEKKNEKNSN